MYNPSNQDPRYRQEPGYDRSRSYDPDRRFDRGDEDYERSAQRPGRYESEPYYASQFNENDSRNRRYGSNWENMSRGGQGERSRWSSNPQSGSHGWRGDESGGNYYGDRERGGYAGSGAWNSLSNERDGESMFMQEPRNRQDRGQFTGRGPKGYQRSDDRITEDVNEALSQNGELDASEIEVRVQNGEVTLSGTVDERQFKRLAEELAERCPGVRDVRNEIRVQRTQGESSSQQSRAKSTTGNSGKQSEVRAS